MEKGNHAELTVKKILLDSVMLGGKTQLCKVLHMDENAESLYLSLDEGDLTELSLDCIYDCRIRTAGEEEFCTGRIKERYVGPAGKIVKLQIENGFYKISIK